MSISYICIKQPNKKYSQCLLIWTCSRYCKPSIKVEARKKILLIIAEQENERTRLKELEEFLENHELEIEKYDEDLVKKLISEITVYDESLKVVLKSGMEVVIDK